MHTSEQINSSGISGMVSTDVYVASLEEFIYLLMLFAGNGAGSG